MFEASKAAAAVAAAAAAAVDPSLFLGEATARHGVLHPAAPPKIQKPASRRIKATRWPPPPLASARAGNGKVTGRDAVQDEPPFTTTSTLTLTIEARGAS